MKIKLTDRLMMLLVHSLQTEAWCESILTDKECKHEFKMLVRVVHVATSRLNKFMQSWTNDDDYEVSAEVSDSLLKIMRMDNNKIKELTEIINKYVEKNK